MILGVSVDAIEHDYFLSDDALVQDREARVAEIRSIGLTEEWAFTSKILVSGLANHLEEKYGGLDAYLDGIGFDKGQRYKVREALLY
jgi:protein-tyrosine phosphatase